VKSVAQNPMAINICFVLVAFFVENQVFVWCIDEFKCIKKGLPVKPTTL
jgi:hypothetical protein